MNMMSKVLYSIKEHHSTHDTISPYFLLDFSFLANVTRAGDYKINFISFEGAMSIN